MLRTRYFHLYANGKTVKELTGEEYIAIRQKSLGYKTRKKMTVRVHMFKGEMELAIAKGRNYTYLTMRQIRKLEQYVET